MAAAPTSVAKKPRRKWVKDAVVLPDIGQQLKDLMAKGELKQLVIRERKTSDGKIVYRVTVF
jgi:hypothetical protein